MEEINTPQLKEEEFRFCKVIHLKKKPFEDNWNEEGYKSNDPELLKHLKQGGNAGIIAGFGNLRILDIDDKKLIEHFDEVLGDTFAVETANGNRHYYILSEYDKNHVLANKSGEFRAKKQMVLIPGCEVE